MPLVFSVTSMIACSACGQRLVFPARAVCYAGQGMKITMSTALADPHLDAHRYGWPRLSKHERLAYAKRSASRA